MDKREVKHYAVPEWADTLAIGAGDAMPLSVVKAAPALLEALEAQGKAVNELMTEFISKKRAANWGVINDAGVTARAAIAQARGGQ